MEPREILRIGVPTKYLPKESIPAIVELPEWPPEGQTVYIPHRQRNGVKANQWSMAFTIKRTGNTDTFIPCSCEWCYQAWSRGRKR